MLFAKVVCTPWFLGWSLRRGGEMWHAYARTARGAQPGDKRELPSFGGTVFLRPQKRASAPCAVDTLLYLLVSVINFYSCEYIIG